MRKTLMIFTLVVSTPSFAASAKKCETAIGAKVTKENALPGAIVRVNEVIRNGVQSGKLGEIPYLRVYVEPGGVFEGGFGAPAGTQLEILAAPKKYQGLVTAIKVRDVNSPREGYVFWVEFKGSTSLVQAAREGAIPPAEKQQRARKLKFPEKMRMQEFESLARAGQTWYGRPFAKTGEWVWVGNLPRSMSPNNVGQIVELKTPLTPGDWGRRGIAKVATLAGKTIDVYHYDCNPISQEELNLVRETFAVR